MPKLLATLNRNSYPKDIAIALLPLSSLQVSRSLSTHIVFRLSLREIQIGSVLERSQLRSGHAITIFLCSPLLPVLTTFTTSISKLIDP